MFYDKSSRADGSFFEAQNCRLIGFLLVSIIFNKVFNDIKQCQAGFNCHGQIDESQTADNDVCKQHSCTLPNTVLSMC